MKLCLIKVAKSDVCIRPLFANPVTNIVPSLSLIQKLAHANKAANPFTIIPNDVTQL